MINALSRSNLTIKYIDSVPNDLRSIAYQNATQTNNVIMPILRATDHGAMNAVNEVTVSTGHKRCGQDEVVNGVMV